MYENIAATKKSGTDGLYATAVGLPYIEAVNPAWLLLNRIGQRVLFRDYPNLLAVDIGAPSYQQVWANNVLVALRAGPWDGVFIDDVNPTMRYHYDVKNLAKYPSDGAYAAAMNSALAVVGPRIRATGKLAIGNIGSWADHPREASRFLDHLDGGMDEEFAKWGSAPGIGYVTGAQWQRQIREVAECGRRHKLFIGLTHSPIGDVAAATYGWASLLLGAKSHTAYLFGGAYEQQRWFPVFSVRLGEPLGAAYALRSGLRARRFRRGIVLVNPTTQQHSVALGGAFSGVGYRRVKSVTLLPLSAAVLHRVALR